MKHCLGVLLALLICLSFAACAEKYVGKDIAEKDITDFCYTFDVPLEVSEYQRYRFWTEDGKKLFFHETRRGGSWPLTEEYTVKSGTVALTDEEWAAFLSCLQDGMADAPDPEPVDGDSGPWMQLYWTGDEGRYHGAEGVPFAFRHAQLVLADAAQASRMQVHEALGVHLVGPAHMIQFVMAGIGLGKKQKRAFPDRVPFVGLSAAERGLAGKLAVAQHLGRKALVNAGARVLDVGAEHERRNARAHAFIENGGHGVACVLQSSHPPFCMRV